MSGNTTPRTAAEVEAELHSIDLNAPNDDLEAAEAEAEAAKVAAEAAEAEKKAATEAAEAEAAEIAAAEREAGRKGWVPKDKFKGDPATWVDAKTFIARGERFVVNLQREIQQLQQRVADFEGTKKAFAQFYEEQLEKKDKELAAAISKLRIQRSEAIQEGEHEEAVAIEDRIDLLQGQRKTLRDDIDPNKQGKPAGEVKKPAADEGAPDGQKHVVDPVILEWVEDGNKWFDDDQVLRNFAIATGEQLVENGEKLRGRLLLDKIAGIVRQEFPRKFRQATTGGGEKLPDLVDGGDNSAAGKGGAKTEKDLPEEDRKLMNQFIREGLTTKEKFLKSYFGR